MKHPHNWQPISQAQKDQLDIQQFSEDPKDRLSTGYYTLHRHLAIQDYYKAVEEARVAEDYDMMEEAREMFLSSLETLRNDFIGDLKLIIQLELSHQNIWHPFKVELVGDLE